MLRRRDVLALMLSAPFAARAESEPDAAVRAILVERIDVGRQSVGMIAVTLHEGQRRLVTYGHSGTADDRALDVDTVFEIGSITKVFTALLLADMVQRREVALDDPVAALLPPGTRIPERGRPITLLDLATYSSGLPNMPDNFAPSDPANPYADYTAERMYAFLATHTLKFDPATHYEYANLGFAVLGHALAARAGKNYEELVTERICAPLGLHDTRIALTPAMTARMVQGHDVNLFPTPNWDLNAFAGSGALRSTANDMCSFLEACMGQRDTALSPAMAALLQTRRPAYNSSTDVALGWFAIKARDDEIIWKEGGTGGASSFIGYSPRSRQGAVLLSNAGYMNSVNDIGFHLVNPAFPVKPQRRSVAIEPDRLDGLVGVYRFTPTFTGTVTRQGARLFAQRRGQAMYEIFPASDAEFFYRVVDAQLTFERGSDGRADSVVLHQNGKDLRGIRFARPGD
jgi:D-alanyl-D-alanine-carboxypeptidase/D-alanyl-D-alanine-endopeptidase